MKIDDFKKVSEELNRKIEKNNKKLCLYDEKIRMNKVNSLECRLHNVSTFSMFGYIGIIICTTLMNFTPNLTYPLILFGGSLGIGSLITGVMNKVYKVKERFKSYSNAKTEIEKLEEEITYQIEFEKIKNKNKALYKVVEVLASKETMLRQISNQYNITEKDNYKTIQDTNKKINDLNKFLKKEYEILDVLSTKKILHDRFWRTRSNIQQFINILLAGVVSISITMLFLGVPFFIIDRALVKPYLFTTIIGSVSANMLGITVYLLKRNSNYRKVFNILNSKLKDNALSKKYKKDNEAYLENTKIKSGIEAQIKNISEAILKLKEEEKRLAVLTEQERELQSESKKLDFNKFYVTEEHVKLALEDTSAPLNIDAIYDDKGPMLQRKKL